MDYHISVDEITQEHLDPTSEISIETVKSRTIKGVLALTGRGFILYLISFVAQGFLWAFLSRTEFGVFLIVSAIVNFLVYFSDIGLAGALIQKKDRLTQEDLKTTFTVQQALVLTLLIVLFIVSPVLKTTYLLSKEGIFLLYSLGISFFLSSLKSIPSVLLERKLEFGKFIIPQIIETVVYNVAVVFLAWKGFGISSFSYSVLLRGIVGVGTIYLIQPWRPGFAFSLTSLKELLRFGVPYQLNTLLAVFKDDGMTVLLGSILGADGIGTLGFARKLAQIPLRFFMDNVTRVTFPAFARMQDEGEHLKRAVSRSVFFITFLVFPSLAGLVVLSPIIVRVIPGYEKWIVALVPLAILSIDTIFASISTQLTNALTSIGKIKTVFKLMIMWTTLTFLFVPALALKFGVIGASLGYSLVGISSIVAIIVAKRFIDFSLTDAAGKTAFAAVLMAIVLFALRNLFPASLYSLGTLVVIGSVVYGATVFLLVGLSLIEDVKKTFAAFFSK